MVGPRLSSLALESGVRPRHQLDREHDRLRRVEAATIDGAGPLRTLLTIIVPQAKAAIVAVALFHFVFACNDLFEPFIYLADKVEAADLGVRQARDVGAHEMAVRVQLWLEGRGSAERRYRTIGPSTIRRRQR